MRVILATEEHMPAILAMASKFYDTTHYKDFAPFCTGSVDMLATRLIHDGLLLIAEEDGVPLGMVGLIFAPFMFNNAKRVAYEVVWWVDPAVQGHGVGKALLEAIEPGCKLGGCQAIQMVHLADSPPQAGALYERLGYRHTEKSYAKEVA